MKKDGVAKPQPIIKLGELLGEDSELFKYYPDLKKTDVLFSDTLPDGTAGSFDGTNIELNAKELNRFDVDDLNNENVYGTLLHEVQHAIQEKEGFALGGNLQTSTTEDGINAIIEKKERRRADIKTRLDANNKILSDPENLKMSAELEGKTEKEVRDQLAETVDQQAAEYDTLGLQIERLRHTKAPSMTDARDLYHRLAGEVEARNVTERMGMTGEQRRQSLASETEDVSREDQVIINGEGGVLSFTDSNEEFDRVRDKAVRENGIVVPGLKDKYVTIVPSKKDENGKIHPFDSSLGETALKNQVRKYAKDHADDMLGDVDVEGGKVNISIQSISEMADQKSISRSEQNGVNKDVHLAAITNIKKVIANSVDCEIFPDYLKGNDNKRRPENGYNPTTLMHVFYGAIDIDGKQYAVRSLVKEVKGSNPNKAYMYSLDEIELSPNTGAVESKLHRKTDNSVSVAKLLNNVEKSKDSGKYLLDESKKTQDNENNSLKFQKVENDTHSDNFKNFFCDWEKEPENASKIVDREGEPMVVYHQTANDFTVFDPRHKGAGANDYQLPFGIFMKPSARDIGVGGKKQMALYANIRRPLRVENRQALSRLLQSNVEGYREALAEYEKIDREYSKKFDKAMKFDHVSYMFLLIVVNTACPVLAVVLAAISLASSMVLKTAPLHTLEICEKNLCSMGATWNSMADSGQS